MGTWWWLRRDGWRVVGCEWRAMGSRERHGCVGRAMGREEGEVEARWWLSFLRKRLMRWRRRMQGRPAMVREDSAPATLAARGRNRVRVGHWEEGLGFVVLCGEWLGLGSLNRPISRSLPQFPSASILASNGGWFFLPRSLPNLCIHYTQISTVRARGFSAFPLWFEMDPNAVKSTLSNLAFGNVMAAAARDYQKELLAQEKVQASSSSNQEVDLDDLMDDPELEKLHADRIAALKKEAEKRQEWKKKGHGEYREITEGDFLAEVTGSEKVICHFYHKEFYRCKIMDKHLKSLSLKHIDTKFIKLDAENAPFFVAKLAIKTLPCVILFRQGVAGDRLIGFQDLGGKDEFSTRTLEALLIKKGIIDEKKYEDDENDGYDENTRRTVRSSVVADSDSD
ncbi:hypothetical protein HN51_058738 [Arachis hypogaea]|nr:Thioredoxin domain-containing proteinB [Arachis hypogaea]